MASDQVPKEVTRHISREVERELWARAAGRCQFDGCNRPLYKSPVTQESVNIAEKAHIYSFSEHGPRGWGPLKWKPAALNHTSNLMLVCHDCHKTIDGRKDGGRYPAALLQRWKSEHEARVYRVTGIAPNRKSQVVLYGANIGGNASPLQPGQANLALFPDWYPADERAIELSMSWTGEDRESEFWRTESENLDRCFDRMVRPRVAEDAHFSVFGFAPIPLLIKLGALLTDKVAAQVYQLHREPHQSWKWIDGDYPLDYHVLEPQVIDGPPALILSLSAKITRERVTSVVGNGVTIWELAIESPNNDFLKTPQHLSEFRTKCRKIVALITKIHGANCELSIFPAVPVACAVELGRIRMPKADSPWLIYDQQNQHGAFVPVLRIGG